MALKTPIRTVYDGAGAAVGLAEFQNGEVVGVEHGGTGANTIALVRASFSIDNSNIRALLSVSGSGSYDNATGVITVTGGVTEVGGATGTVSNVQLASSLTQSGLLTTANVTEVTNLYFSNTRVYSNVVSIGYATNANVALKANVVDLTTANVTEVTNLYFSNARARAAFTAGAGIDITSGTISVASTIDYGLIDGELTASNDYGSI